MLCLAYTYLHIPVYIECLHTYIHIVLLLFILFISCEIRDELLMYRHIKMTANNMALSVVGNGHRFAICASSSPLTPTSVLNEMFSGMQQVIINHGSFCFFALMYILPSWKFIVLQIHLIVSCESVFFQIQLWNFFLLFQL